MKRGANGYGFNLHSDKSKPGQFIRSVDADSPAEAAGLQAQDRIVEVTLLAFFPGSPSRPPPHRKGAPGADVTLSAPRLAPGAQAAHRRGGRKEGRKGGWWTEGLTSLMSLGSASPTRHPRQPMIHPSLRVRVRGHPWSFLLPESSVPGTGGDRRVKSFSL